VRGRRAPRSPQALLRSLEGSDHRGRKCVGRGIATRSGVAAPPALKDVILGALDDEGGQQYLAEQDLPHSAPGAELKRTLQGPNRLVRNCLGLETRVGSAIPAVIGCEASPDHDCAPSLARKKRVGWQTYWIWWTSGLTMFIPAMS